MAKTSSFDTSSAVAAIEEAQNLIDRHQELSLEKVEIEERLAALGMAGNGTKTRKKPGPKAGKKAQGAKASKKSGGKGSGRTSSPEGLSVADHLVRDILPPASSKEGCDRTEALEALEGLGVHVGGKDPRIIVGQNFSTLKNTYEMAQSVGRGSYKLNAEGEAYRKQLLKDKKAAEAEDAA